jgi:hypothetical protein
MWALMWKIIPSGRLAEQLMSKELKKLLAHISNLFSNFTIPFTGMWALMWKIVPKCKAS